MTCFPVVVIRYLAIKTNTNQALTHPGSIIILFYYLYCVVPTLFFLTNTIEGAPISWYSYADEELEAILWRSMLLGFVLSVSVCFFATSTQRDSAREGIKFTGASVLLACFALALPNVILEYLSAPVETYYDFYTRFDHLTGFLGTVSVVCRRMIWGFTPILVFILSVYFKDSLIKYVLCILVIIGYTVINSYGARIDAILIVIQAVCYRFLWARKSISKWQIVAVFPAAALSMYVLRYMEIIRLGTESNIDITFATALLAAPVEFFALMFPGIELYRLSSGGPMQGVSYYFKDIITLIPFVDTSNYDLMYWYWKTFAPNAPVAPSTMGVLADPAILGDWWLIVQGVVIGKLANVVNRFRGSSNIYLLAAFGYLASNGVLVLKYNMLTYVDMFVNNFLLGIALLWVILTVQRSARPAVGGLAPIGHPVSER